MKHNLGRVHSGIRYCLDRDCNHYEYVERATMNSHIETSKYGPGWPTGCASGTCDLTFKVEA